MFSPTDSLLKAMFSPTDSLDDSLRAKFLERPSRSTTS